MPTPNRSYLLNCNPEAVNTCTLRSGNSLTLSFLSHLYPGLYFLIPSPLPTPDSLTYFVVKPSFEKPCLEPLLRPLQMQLLLRAWSPDSLRPLPRDQRQEDGSRSVSFSWESWGETLIFQVCFYFPFLSWTPQHLPFGRIVQRKLAFYLHLLDSVFSADLK